MTKQIILALTTGLILGMAVPVGAATDLTTQKAVRLESVLSQHAYEDLEDKATRELVYKNLGPNLGGSLILQEKMGIYAEQDQALLEKYAQVGRQRESGSLQKNAEAGEVAGARKTPVTDMAASIQSYVGADPAAASTKLTEEMSAPKNAAAAKRPPVNINADIETQPTNETDGLNLDNGKGEFFIGALISPTFTGESSELGNSGGQNADNDLNAQAILGLGNNLGVSYRYNRNSVNYGANFGGNAGGYDGSINFHELDLLYKVAPGLAVTAGIGYNDVKDTLTINNVGSVKGTDSRVYPVLGLMGKWQFNPFLSLKASAGWSRQLARYDIGLGLAIAANTDLYLGYSDYNFKDMQMSGSIVDGLPFSVDSNAHVYGFNAGLNFKF